MKAVLVIGLPASGKTTFVCKHLNDHYYFHNAIIVDDPCTLSSVLKAVDISKTKQRNLVVVDPHFCMTDCIDRAELFFKEKGYEVEKIFFENDPEQCIVNSRNRNKKVKHFIRFLSKLYFPPKNSLPVYRAG